MQTFYTALRRNKVLNQVQNFKYIFILDIFDGALPNFTKPKSTMDLNSLIDKFLAIYPGKRDDINLYFAPGRVNLIGEHTDYNGGYVFPCALNFGTYLAVRKTGHDHFQFATTNFDSRGTVSFAVMEKKVNRAWFNYPLGVINQFMHQGEDPLGMEMLFSGNIPNGAGLSSSASIEMVMAVALNDLLDAGMSMVDLALISQRAENEFVGMNCGIMDQFASGLGQKEAAIFLNCDTLEYEQVPLILNEYRLIIANTNKHRGLQDSKYNERRSECEKAVSLLRRKVDIPHLSALSLEDFLELENLIEDDTIKRRARHVISENRRVLDAVPALKSGNIELFGELMNRSHDSLRTDYEVTGRELDTLVDESRKIAGVVGSRMTGAGFGGCTVTFVNNENVDDFISSVGKAYYNEIGILPDFYMPEIGEGAHKIER